jgi:hypothetical protein
MGDGTKGINIFRQQANRGTFPVAYLKTTSFARFGLAIDYNPVTHLPEGCLAENKTTKIPQLILKILIMPHGTITVTSVIPNVVMFLMVLAEINSKSCNRAYNPLLELEFLTYRGWTLYLLHLLGSRN